MAHFAEIDENNVVMRVVVIDISNTIDSNNNEVESIGSSFCENLFGGGKWIKTSYNGNIRKRYAQVGGTYDSINDIFIDMKPYDSWILDNNTNWIPPVPYPKDLNYYEWDESTISWKLIMDNSNADDKPNSANTITPNL